ncbi:MAG: lyase family protein [Patescibacteria group bacterium]|jgi:argininosuccinate lyase
MARKTIAAKSKKIWQTTGDELDSMVEAYTVGDDYLMDQLLLPYDIEASLAHAEMLKTIGILSGPELKKARLGLYKILTEYKKGNFIIRQGQEDGHMAIEEYLTAHYGDIGKKIHTGRSRNDQALVMVRLFMKDSLTEIAKLTERLAISFQAKIKEAKNIPMPGYTHMQKAMPTTVGVWLDSYLAAIKDFIPMLKAARNLIDQNPLGSASGYGIDNLFLNRELTTKKLKFAKTQKNPMYCGFSRGYFENIVLQALSQIMIIAGRFASDMVIFTTQEFGFFSLPDSFTTGSSIMPQKRNYDIFEIMRGNAKVFHSYQARIQEIISSLGSGYHRDLTLTKKPLVLGINLCIDTIEILAKAMPNIRLNENRLKKAMTADLYATNEVYELVKKGRPFRDAYLEIKNKFKEKNS